MKPEEQFVGSSEQWLALFMRTRRIFGLPTLPYDDGPDERTSDWSFFSACQMRQPDVVVPAIYLEYRS